MKVWIPLLIILPAGVVAGLMGARMVDPGHPLDDPATSARQPAALPAPSPTRQAYAAYEEEAHVRAAGRPDLDWGREVWPEDYDRRAEADDGAYYGRYGDDYDDPYREGEAGHDRPGRAPRDPTAEQAGRAAARAAADAVTAAGQALPDAAAPREPRAADGDLPAIW